MSVFPDPSYVFDTISVTDDETNESIEVNDKGADKYSFVMPDNSVTVNVGFAYKTPAEYWEGYGTPERPYIISTNSDWTVLTTAYDYFNDCFKLGRDINVTAPVGDKNHPFTGVFDGAGYKLNLSMSSENDDFAPFVKTSGTDTVIKNLIVEGNISFGKKCGSALVARNIGTLTIENCRVNATLTSSVSGDGNIGGFVGVNNSNCTLIIIGCAFAGTMTGSNTTNSGGFDGYSSGNVDIEDSVFAPSSVDFNESGFATFVYKSNASELTVNDHTFYHGDYGAMKQGKLGYFIEGIDGVTLDFNYDPDLHYDIFNYDVSSVDAFGDFNAIFDGKYIEEENALRTLFKVVMPENYVVDHYYYRRGNDTETWTLSEYEPGASYYSIKNIATDITVGPRQLHKLTYHPRVEPGVNHYGSTEYWECTDCGEYFSEKNVNSGIMKSDVVLPPTNACRNGAVFSVGEDIFFTEDSTILNAYSALELERIIIEKDTIKTIGYDSETNTLTIDGKNLKTVKSSDGKEFTGKFYVKIDANGYYQIYPLYHIIDDDQPVWEWNGHYSATATLTGFAYDYMNWVNVDHTQTIEAQITYTDIEGADEYSARERVYTAAAVTAGKTFYDYKREPLSP